MRQARFKAAPEASMYIITEFRGSWTGGLFWAIPKNWQNMVTGIKFFCVEVITSEASPGLKVPYAANNTRSYFEPITLVDPGETGGTGGAIQFLMERQEAQITEVFDTSLGRALTQAEILGLLGQ